MRIVTPLLMLLTLQICLAQTPALQSYTWKSKTQVEVNGEVRKVMVNQCRYDASGQIQRTAISSSGSSSQPQGPLRARIAERKKEKAEEWVNGLRETLEPYQHVPKEKMKAFLMAGQMKPQGDGTILISGTGLVTPNDQVTVTADMASRQPKKLVVNTSYDNTPLQLEVDLSDIAPGVNAPTSMTISVPDHNLDVVTQNYDFQPL